MFTKQQVGGALFTAMCLGLAAADYFREKPLDPAFVALVSLAILPWALPWLATLMKSLKVGGMEFNFRELQNQIQENREMIQATASAVVSVGKEPGTFSGPVNGPVSHSIPAAEGDDGEIGSRTDDPNLGLFGNKPTAGGFRLSATVKPFPGSPDWFMIRVWVSSADAARPLPDGTKVVFHLHPTFKPPVVSVEAVDGTAALDRVAWGWFTVGAVVEGVRLGLPLNTVPGAPERFKSR